MRRWTLATAAIALLAAALWHLPATAQRAIGSVPATPPAVQEPTQPAAPDLITFDEYRDFRMHDLTQRQARLAQQLATPGLSADQKTTLERKKAYYDKLAEMPAEGRDALFRARFDKIDTNHDGQLDPAERAAWREKQREYYARLAAERTGPDAAQH